MTNFEYHNPVRIIFGEGQIAQIRQQIPREAKVLLLYGGGSIKKNGVYDQVIKALDNHTVLEFSGIEPNPKYETLMEAVELIKKENVGFLLAVGGGSVIDGTKFISVAVKDDGDPWDFCTWKRAPQDSMPFGSVLTLPATGSEMNMGSVVTRGKDKMGFLNPHMYPQFSVLDPTTTYTLPARQVANGVVDAFTHIVEQYMTYPSDSPIQDRFAESLLITLIEDGPRALSEPDNYQVRSNIMWAASLALCGIFGCGVPHDWSTHMIGHEITALYGLDHAQTLAVVLPGTWTVMLEQKQDKLAQYAERVWNIKEGSTEEKAKAAIAKTDEFFQSLGVPTRLSGYEIKEGAVDQLVAQLEAHNMVALGENRNITPEISRQILEQRV